MKSAGRGVGGILARMLADGLFPSQILALLIA